LYPTRTQELFDNRKCADPMSVFRDLLRMSRFSHYVKNVFVLPGIIIAMILVDYQTSISQIYFHSFQGLLSISIAASANYVLNEYLDRDTDLFHPNKSSRPAAKGRIKFRTFSIYYFTLAMVSFVISLWLTSTFSLVILLFLGSGIIYNVRPLRLKDRYLLDVITESFNNVLRFLAGWFLVTQEYFPPITLLMSYWWIGAFLMTAKRLAEIQGFETVKQAIQYRTSFSQYTVAKLRSLSFLYGALALMSLSIFAIKYESGFVFMIPILAFLFTYYFHVSDGLTSVAQNPENLWRDRKLIILISIFCLQAYFVIGYDDAFFTPLVQSELLIINK
jgi:decaprenyl-phosphate phosphoribosyltransferase